MATRDDFGELLDILTRIDSTLYEIMKRLPARQLKKKSSYGAPLD